MKKRFLLFAVFALCIISFMSIGASASTDSTEKVKALRALGILSENTEALSSFATKGDALKATVSVFANIECEPEQVYSNITSVSEYFKDVYLAKKIGVMISDNNTFNPGDYVTAEDYAAMLLTASGYDFICEKFLNSMYPYTMAATDIKVYERKFSGSEKLTYEDIFNAMYELLQTPSPSMYFTNGYISYSTDNSSTIADTVLGIKISNGIVIGNQYTNLRADRKLSENCMEINTDDGGYLTLYESAGFYGLLGYHCTVFYKNENGKNIVIYALKSDNGEVYIDGDDFDRIDTETLTVYYTDSKSSTRFEQHESEHKKKIQYGSNIIYNGQYTDNAEYVFGVLADPKNLNIDFVSLVDNNGDGKTDVIIADVYRNFGIKSINKNNNTYAFTSTEYDVITIDDNACFYKVTIDGVPDEYQKFAVDMVLTVKKGLGEKPLITLDAINNNILGRFYTLEIDSQGNAIAEISVAEATERGSNVVGSYVGGIDNQLHIVQYKLDNGLSLKADDILTGNHLYRLLIDKRGKICALGVYSSSDLMWHMTDFGANTYTTIEFGIGVEVSKESKLSSILKLKLATIKKELRTVTLETYKTSKKLKILNIPSDICSKYGTDWKLFPDEAFCELFLDKLFEISFDSDGYINKITFPYEEIQEGRLSNYNTPGQTYVYKAHILRSMTSDDFLYEYSKHMCIMIPKAGTSPGYDQLYRIIYFNGNTFVENGMYQINNYTFSKSSYVPEIMVLISDYSKAEVVERLDNIGLGVVSKAYTISGDNGPTDAQDVYGMFGVSQLGIPSVLVSVYGKTYKPAPASEASDRITIDGYTTYFKKNISELETYDDPIDYGDVVLYGLPYYSTASSGVRHYTDALKLYDYGTKTIVQTQNGSANGTTNVIRGKIKNIDDKFFSVLPEGAEDTPDELLDLYSENGAANRIYVFTPLDRAGKGTVTVGEKVDLEDAKINNWDVLVFGRKFIVIYKN